MKFAGDKARHCQRYSTEMGIRRNWVSLRLCVAKASKKCKTQGKTLRDQWEMLLLEDNTVLDLVIYYLITSDYKAPVCCVHEVLAIQTMKYWCSFTVLVINI